MIRAFHLLFFNYTNYTRKGNYTTTTPISQYFSCFVRIFLLNIWNAAQAAGFRPRETRMCRRGGTCRLSLVVPYVGYDQVVAVVAQGMF